MIPHLLLLVSDWNPQFFRELKGRLKPRNIALTIATSLLVQSAILLYLWAVLPSPTSTYSRYCTSKTDYLLSDCVLDATGNPIINWQIWWSDLFQSLSWLLPFVLLIGGVYLLIGDLAKEERRGTLNFIRLSPRSSQSILIGKLLGVPLIPFLAVVLAIPLHLWSAAQAGISAEEVVSIYLVTGAACCFFYSGSIFYAFLGGAQNWLGAAAVWFSYTIFFQLWQIYQHDSSYYLGLKQWYNLPIGESLSFAVAFAVMNFGIGTFWIWRAINRRFRNPNQTLISKRQSYAMTLCFELLMFGFVFREHHRWDHPIYDLMTMIAFNLVWFLVLIAALTPHRQTLLDWARYRRDGGAAKAKRVWRRSMLRDLVWGEKSPAIGAIALNLFIPVAVFTPWILIWEGADQQIRGFLGLLFCMLFLLICAAIAQSILFMKFQKRAIAAVGVVGALMILPAIAMLTLGVHPDHNPAAWLLSAFAFVAMEFASAPAIAFSFLAHLAIFSLFTLRLTRQLRRAGESELKALMAHRTL